MFRVQREYTSDLRQLRDMRSIVRDTCQAAWGQTEHDEAVAELELALSEAATNIILHAYQREPSRPIELNIEADANQVRITLLHEGCAFDPAQAPTPTFDGSRESGYGVYLIKESVDEVKYFQDERGRCGILLVKNRT